MHSPSVEEVLSAVLAFESALVPPDTNYAWRMMNLKLYLSITTIAKECVLPRDTNQSRIRLGGYRSPQVPKELVLPRDTNQSRIRLGGYRSS